MNNQVLNNNNTNVKVSFKCKHCDNDDLRYFQFNSLNYQSEKYRDSPYRNTWDYECTPKKPIGIHIKCAKCGKDTLIIPNEYNGTNWGNDIPQQCIMNVQFQKPPFSAIQYVITDDGYLDKLVVTSNNEIISLLTQTPIDTSIGFNQIGKNQYEILLSKGLEEKKSNEFYESINANGNGQQQQPTESFIVNTNSNYGTGESQPNMAEMVSANTTATTSGNSKSNANVKSTKK